MVDIAGFGQPDDRVDEDVGPSLSGRADGKLAMGAMHRVAGLKGNNFAPREFMKVSTKLRGVVYDRSGVKPREERHLQRIAT